MFTSLMTLGNESMLRKIIERISRLAMNKPNALIECELIQTTLNNNKQNKLI